MTKIAPLDQFLYTPSSPFKVFVHDEEDASNLPQKLIDKKIPILISNFIPKGKAIILDQRGFTYKFGEGKMKS
jgi:hypothetical protein